MYPDSSSQKISKFDGKIRLKKAKKGWPKILKIIIISAA